jgi:hypothetical protein
MSSGKTRAPSWNERREVFDFPLSSASNETHIANNPPSSSSRLSHEVDIQELELYEQFVYAKARCGESTHRLTFERFSHMLAVRSASLCQCHGWTKVRFAVAVRDGRVGLMVIAGE